MRATQPQYDNDQQPRKFGTYSEEGRKSGRVKGSEIKSAQKISMVSVVVQKILLGSSATATSRWRDEEIGNDDDLLKEDQGQMRNGKKRIGGGGGDKKVLRKLVLI